MKFNKKEGVSYENIAKGYGDYKDLIKILIKK
jgi:hypothetical protein